MSDLPDDYTVDNVDGDDVEPFDTTEPFDDDEDTDDPPTAEDDAAAHYGRLHVTLPSGAVFPLLSAYEARFVQDRADRYQAQNHFQNISDLADIDRLLTLELFSFRWTHWLSEGQDYSGEDINDTQLRKSVADYSVEIRRLKAQMGVDKTSRDKARGEDSVSEFLLRLLQRAKEFGVHRDEQAAMIIELGQQLIALMTYYDNMDDVERREAGLTKDDFFDWIRNVFRPEFEALDVAFRLNQKMWVRDL